MIATSITRRWRTGPFWLAATALILAQTTGAARAQDDQPIWYNDASADQARLVYGVPDSDYSPIVFICDAGSPDISIYLYLDAVADSGDADIPVRVAAGGAEAVFPARSQAQEMDDQLYLKGTVRLDGGLEGVLASTGELALEVKGATVRYPLAGAAEAAGPLLAACGRDLHVTVTNKASVPVVNFLFSEAEVNDFNGDTFDNQFVKPDESLRFAIPDGRKVCTFDLIAEFDEEAERDPVTGRQNLCEDSEFVVR